VIICSSIYIALANLDERYWLMWLFPIVYAIVLMLIDISAGQRSKEIGYRAIKIVMLFRYVITPISIVATQYYSGPGPEPTKSTMTMAVVLMIYELICVGIAIAIYSIYTNRKIGNINNYIKQPNNIISERNPLVWIFIIITFFIIASINIRLIVSNNFIVITNEIERISSDGEISGLVIILRNVLRVVMGMAILNLINKIKASDKVKVFLSLGSLLLILSLYTSNTRWDTLIISLVGIILLCNLYPRYTKIIFSSIGSVMVVALTSVTIYKFLGHETLSISSFFPILQEMIEVISKQFQVYFSGPRNVALAIDMSNTINANIIWLINDLLGSLPGLSHFFDQSIRFNLLFNQYIYSGNTVSQIIPLVGIGYNAVGFLLSPVVTVGFILLVLKLNNIYKKKVFILDKYLLLYMILYTSLCMGMNIQILTNKYYAVFIPSALFLYVIRIAKNFILHQSINKQKYR
jgi:hypothetical protein